jgi:hypothetical protein
VPYNKEITEALKTLVDADFRPGEYVKAYAAGWPPPQVAGDPSKVRVGLVEYGYTTAVFDRAEYEQAKADGRLDHLIDCDVSDMETDTYLVDPDGTTFDPYA